MKARIYVTLKEGVLDPAGKAVQSGLSALGHHSVSNVRIGKFFEVELSGGDASRDSLDSMCKQLLANTVMEDYRIEVEGECGVWE